MALLLVPASATRSYAIPADLLALLPAAPARADTLQLAPAAAPDRLAVTDPQMIERYMLTLLTLAQDGLLEVVPNGGLNKASLLRIARQLNAQDTLKGAWREDHWP